MSDATALHMNRFAALIIAITSTAVLNIGCVVEAQTEAYVAEPEMAAFYEPPPLIMVEPGIYIVRDSALPIYYVDGSYWCYRHGVWYSAWRWYDPWFWVGVHTIPYVIVHRDHHRYVYYHGHSHDRVYREHVPPRPWAHDRGPAGPPKVDPIRRPAQPKVVPYRQPSQPKTEPRSIPRTEPRPSPRPTKMERLPAPSRPSMERQKPAPTRIERTPQPVQPKVEPRRTTPPKVEPRRIAPPKVDTRRRPSDVKPAPKRN